MEPGVLVIAGIAGILVQYLIVEFAVRAAVRRQHNEIIDQLIIQNRLMIKLLESHGIPEDGFKEILHVGDRYYQDKIKLLSK